MKLTIASISPRTRSKSEATDRLTADYLARIARYAACSSETHASEDALFAALDKFSTRTVAHLILLESTGKQLTSEEVMHHQCGHSTMPDGRVCECPICCVRGIAGLKTPRSPDGALENLQ